LFADSRYFGRWFRRNGHVEGLFWDTSRWFFRRFELSFSLAISGFFFLLFIVSIFFFQISWRRDEGAGRGVDGNPVSTVATRGSLLRDFVSGSVPAHVVQGVQVQTFVPGACEHERCVSSGPRIRMPPLVEPLAGTLKSLREAADVIRHRFPGLEALEDLQRGCRQFAKMPNYGCGQQWIDAIA
jgi:hypothetical protein